MTIATKNGSVILKGGSVAQNCGCCGGWYCYSGGIQWNGFCQGYLFADSPEDFNVNAPVAPKRLSSNGVLIPNAKVVVDYFCNRCPDLGIQPNRYYPHWNYIVAREFVNEGGIYITNCESDACAPAGFGCDNGYGFDLQMENIGSALRRGAGSVSTNFSLSSSGAPIFSGCSFAFGGGVPFSSGSSGIAMAEIANGDTLAIAAPGSQCIPQYETGGAVVVGQKIGCGAVIAVGTSTLRINGNFRQNLLSLPVNSLF